MGKPQLAFAWLNCEIHASGTGSEHAWPDQDPGFAVLRTLRRELGQCDVAVLLQFLVAIQGTHDASRIWLRSM